MRTVLCGMLVIGCLLAGSLSEAAETYTISMLPDVAWSYYQVAEVKGLWEKQGVSVKLVHYTNPPDVIRGAIKRRVDFVPLPMPVIAGYQESGGADMTYLGTFSISDQHKYLIIKNDLANKSLKGQTIGIFANEHQYGQSVF